MPAFAASAPAKIILFGEHAVVYDRPAIAVPVTQVQARVTISANPTGPQGQIWITSRETRLDKPLSELPPGHAFAITIQGVLDALKIVRMPAARLQITSTIPVAAGLGSGAAVSVAMARALAAFLGRKISDEQVSAIAYQAEQKYHGTPSGIDNTVITYAKPVFFMRGQPFEFLTAAVPFTLVIGNTGIPSSTAAVVADVRNRREDSMPVFERLFDSAGEISQQARQAVEKGQVERLGALMNENHALLQEIGVSCPELDRLVAAARDAGAAGAKLSGAGRGGNMIALVAPALAPAVEAALRSARAVDTITTTVAAGKR
jgi:mevalonate kinase